MRQAPARRAGEGERERSRPRAAAVADADAIVREALGRRRARERINRREGQLVVDQACAWNRPARPRVVRTLDDEERAGVGEARRVNGRRDPAEVIFDEDIPLIGNGADEGNVDRRPTRGQPAPPPARRRIVRGPGS